MSVWAGGGVVAMKYAYGFCIHWMSALCMISSLLSVASNNHNHRPWLTPLYVANVLSTQATHSCKAKSILLPESNSSAFYTQIWNLSKVKMTTAFFSKSWRILVVVATWRHHKNGVLKLKKKTALTTSNTTRKIWELRKGRIKSWYEKMGGGIAIHEQKFHKNANRSRIDEFH